MTQYGLRGIHLKTADDNIISIPHNTIGIEAIANANNRDLEAQVVIDFYFAHLIKLTQI